ncbi:hypothetical protein M8C21_025389, partial [Ambrosia artemisiifolia]
PILLSIILYIFFNVYLSQKSKTSKTNLPPGSFGWPFIGESLSLLRAGWDGVPERFVRERIEKHGSPLVFKTSLLGDHVAVLCGPVGNKFLFGNENKLVAAWWPSSVRKLFGRCLITIRGDEAKWMRKMLLSYLGPEAFVSHYATTMDVVTRRHIEVHWREEGKASSSQDLLSHMLSSPDENGRHLTEMEIANNILLLLFAGHDTSTVTITLVMKALSEHPDVYDKVLKGGLYTSKAITEVTITDNNFDFSDFLPFEVAAKEVGELLKWEDIQKMRYSWNVVCEVIRLNPPVTGAFREALVDFEYAGYNIPKGWKLYWSSSLAHKDEANFEDVTRFDPSRTNSIHIRAIWRGAEDVFRERIFPIGSTCIPSQHSHLIQMGFVDTR